MLNSKGNAEGDLRVVALRSFCFNRSTIAKDQEVDLPKVFALEMVTNGNARIVRAAPAKQASVVAPPAPQVPKTGDGDHGDEDQDQDEDQDEDQDGDDDPHPDETDDDGFAGNPLASRRRRGRPRKDT